MIAASMLRMVAQNILAVLRALSRRAATGRKPNWRDVIEHALFALFESNIDASEFDAELAATAA